MRFFKKLFIVLSFVFTPSIFPKLFFFDKFMQNNDESNIASDINNVIKKIEK